MKKNIMKSLLCVGVVFTMVGCSGGDSSSIPEETVVIPTEEITTKNQLGEKLFNDTSLSLNRTMSCATCHNPNQAFIDTRTNVVDGAVSLGDDGTSLGDRNTPTISYAAFTPPFNVNTRTGGQFLDGRSSNLTEQAKQPFLNPIEMQMPNEESVVNRVKENSTYIAMMESIYGSNIFDNTSNAFNAIADAIASFENTNVFSPFDSDFDRNAMSREAMMGQRLFIMVNCVRCHDIGGNALFANFTYENLGVPANVNVRNRNDIDIDLGLSQNPLINDSGQDGRFKVNTLRNVAVTAPYMHNGVFRDLKTVVHFYNTRDVPGAINPETGQEWRSPEVRQNMTSIDVGNLGLTDAEENAIVEFLKTLTDARYK